MPAKSLTLRLSKVALGVRAVTPMAMSAARRAELTKDPRTRRSGLLVECDDPMRRKKASCEGNLLRQPRAATKLVPSP